MKLSPTFLRVITPCSDSGSRESLGYRRRAARRAAGVYTLKCRPNLSAQGKQVDPAGHYPGIAIHRLTVGWDAYESTVEVGKKEIATTISTTSRCCKALFHLVLSCLSNLLP